MMLFYSSLASAKSTVSHSYTDHFYQEVATTIGTMLGVKLDEQESKKLSKFLETKFSQKELEEPKNSQKKSSQP